MKYKDIKSWIGEGAYRWVMFDRGSFVSCEVCSPVAYFMKEGVDTPICELCSTIPAVHKRPDINAAIDNVLLSLGYFDDVKVIPLSGSYLDDTWDAFLRAWSVE